MELARWAVNLGGGRRLVLAGVERGALWLAAGAVALVLLLLSAMVRRERHD